MPTVTLTFSAAAATEINNAFASLYGYRDTIQTDTNEDGTPIMGPNPETKAQFAKRKLIEFVKERVQTHRRAVAIAAVNTTDADVA